MSTKKSKILLVDDDIDILTMMKKTLRSYNVTAFSNPLAAYNAVKNNPSEFCILVTDIRMPGMTGFELSREVRKLNSDIKIIIVSSFEMHLSEFEKTFPSTKIDKVLNKPFHIGDLESGVKEILVNFDDGSLSTGEDRN
jgi:CheY-like chemotaxis protein